MSEGSMENWIGSQVEAFPESENAIVRGTLEEITEYGVVINVSGYIAEAAARGTEGPRYYAWRDILWMHPTDK